MKHLALCILAAACLGLPACTTAPTLDVGEEIIVLEIAPDSVPCVGEMVGQCIQVRTPGEVAWRKFYDPIDGFQHEVGVRFTLRVGRREVLDPPADGSAYAYRLIQVIAREPAGG